MAIGNRATIPLIFGLMLSSIVFTFGKLECEDLPVEDCAFSVASSGTRCVLEKYKGKDDSLQYECQSSIITAEKQEEWIESDECIKSCGLERMSVGLSTDLLMDPRFTEILCSSECLNNCPNLVDLYVSLAAGEGVYLPQLCKTHRMSSRRVIADPVKKATDEEFRRSQLLPSLSSASAEEPGASQIPESGANTAPADGSRGPDYRGYVGGVVVGGGELAPTSPVSGSSTPPAPVAQSPTVSTSKRPFFVPSAPPTGSPTPSITENSVPVAATPEPAPAITTPPEISPSISASAPGVAPEPSFEQGADFLFWQQQSAENLMPDRQQLNDEEYLYETYFH